MGLVVGGKQGKGGMGLTTGGGEGLTAWHAGVPPRAYSPPRDTPTCRRMPSRLRRPLGSATARGELALPGLVGGGEKAREWRRNGLIRGGVQCWIGTSNIIRDAKETRR